MVVKNNIEASRAKSGVRVMKPGEVLFNEGDQADSLYIVQKGQLRLFLKKGKGFVDIAVLHPGEVLGEMAYFDEKSRTRSCSASAIVTTELVEISFNAFGKTMKNLNPWFKTIINTLADRLRSTNAKVKELETSQVSIGRGDKASQYKFFNNVDIVRLLSMIYMVFRAHAKTEEGCYVINLKTVKYYATEIFAISEAKVLEFVNLLEEEGSVEIIADANKLPNVIRTKNYTRFYEWMAFLQGERLTADDRKIVFHERCEKILSRAFTMMDPAKVDKHTGLIPVNLSIIFSEFKAKNVELIPEDFDPAVEMGLAEEILVNEGILTSRMNYAQLQKVFFPVRFMNRVTELNSQKANSKY
ncbi:MAG: cyclic nucleotide-binding domain-containing protein [Bacteriovoracaceae bacterium]|nr:cyclic nucleotide-binding domain-containing protein [Bacteriovoracaceae bacterium]